VPVGAVVTLLAAPVGAAFVASRAGVSVLMVGSTFAAWVESVADGGSTATEARRGTAAGWSFITLGAAEGGLPAGSNCQPPQPAAMARAATAAFAVHCGIAARVTAGHQRQPSREAG
jgi:hypothetical protein